MHRAVIATAGLVCLVAGAGQAFGVADGPVNEGRAAGTSLAFALPGGGSVTLNISAVQGSNGGVLTIEKEQCAAGGGCDDVDYSSPLPGAALTIDGTNPSAQLETTLSGAGLAITWQPSSAAPGAAMQSGSFSGDGVGNNWSTYAGQLADVSVEYGDSSCKGGGGVGDGLVVDTQGVTGDPTVDPVSSLRLPDGAVMSCTG